MRQLRRLILAFVCSCAATAWAQGAPQVFVSTGTAGTIYSINTGTGTSTLLISATNAGYLSPDFEGMVVAPDNAAAAAYPYVVYVCDTKNSRILRFDPTGAKVESIYLGAAGLQHPQCGRITAAGDLVVSSTDKGSSLWIFSGIAGIELGNAGVQTPTALGAAVSGNAAGLAQKNTGDLLVVDNSNSQVLRANAPGFSSSAAFIASNLSAPVGIARRSDGSIFVSNQGGTPNVAQFNAQGGFVSDCETFKGANKGTPAFMQISLDDTLYVAGASNNKGFVQSINASTCSLNNTFSVSSPAVGIALPPTTASRNVVAANGSALINFGFAAFELNQISGACSGSVGISLYSPEQISVLIGLTGLPAGDADPAVNLGLDGFEIVISTANLSGCTAKDGVTYNFQVAGLVNTQVVNPQIVVCDDANASCQPGNVNLNQIGAWPIGGYLPNDIGSGGTKALRCNIFLVSAHPDPNDPAQQQGTFCGFQSPLTNTFPSGTPATFSPGKSIPVKFKLSPGTASSCQSAPYITSAVALLDVAQIADSKGNATFVPIGLISNGSSGLAQPLFKSDGNSQYLFNWDSSSCIMPSGVTQVCPKGTYSVTVFLLTNNTADSTTNPPQSIYTAQTTKVILK